MMTAADRYRKVLHRELATELACLDMQIVRGRARGGRVDDLEGEAEALRALWHRLELPPVDDVPVLMRAVVAELPPRQRPAVKPVAEVLVEQKADLIKRVEEIMTEGGLSAKALRDAGFEKDHIRILVADDILTVEGQGPGRRYKLASPKVGPEKQVPLFEGAPKAPAEDSEKKS